MSTRFSSRETIEQTFALLRPHLRHDLVVWHGIPNVVAGTILNRFDPRNPRYLDNVNDWQIKLCEFHGVMNQDWLRGIPFYTNDTIRAVHQVAKLVYKWHGQPAKETDWPTVKCRLRDPLPMHLKDDEIEGIRRSLQGIKPIDLNQAQGRFGPGATAEGFSSEQKWMRIGYIPDVPPNLYRVNPHDPWTPLGLNSLRATKIAEVPKSIKCNRIVSSEPAMSMYAQLAINDQLVEQLHTLYGDHISLRDQGKHNTLLYDRGMATLDLSDASDHISCDLVEAVLPQLWPVLAKVRSEFAQFPDGELVRLGTFAPMGAGICFSVMTAVITGIIDYAFKSLGFRRRERVYHVYGDDIIVPIWIAQYVGDLLERAGLVLNDSKCCYSGHYRESCGLELLGNTDVTPGYIRDPLGTLDASKVEQLAAVLDRSWFPSTRDAVIRKADAIRDVRFNHKLQKCECLVRTTTARSKLRPLDGYEGLNRWFAIHTQQDVVIKGYEKTLNALSRPSGVETEIWTQLGWRYKPAEQYPHLLEAWQTSGPNARSLVRGVSRDRDK